MYIDNKTPSANLSYWINQPKDFTRYYLKKDNIFHSFVSSFLSKRTVVLLKLIQLKKNNTLLDVGCGSGVHLKQLIDRCAKIYGIDISQEMINEAKIFFQKIYPENKWSLKVADCHKIPFKNNYFDWVIAMGLLDYVEDWKKVIRESVRVLKKHGNLVFSIPKKPSFFGFLRTKTGNQIKKIIFKLPPVKNVISKKELYSYIGGLNLDNIYIESIWSTMWMVKARKA